MTEPTRDGPSPYREPWILRQHVLNVLSFYHPTCLDDVFGGYVAQLDEDDGHVYDGRTKHLVATCRFIYNYCVGDRIDGPRWCRPAAERGLRFLLDQHWDEDESGFDWITAGREPVDRTRYCYGHAFALLACAAATIVDLPGAREGLDRTQSVVRDRFWETEHGLALAEASPDWSTTEAYRGQNANMHLCEASIAAYEATGESRFLEQAAAIAGLVRDPAEREPGFVWEHYTVDWEPDWSYNRNEPEHTFRPWGYQPGHQLEWAKLLVALDRHRDEPWLLDRAASLFDGAIEHGWDDEHGGFYYTLDRDGDPLVTDKYGWPVAEAIGAAALLGARTGEDRFWRWYDVCWRYARETLIARRHGNWRTAVDRTGEPTGDRPSPAVEPGYHPIGNAVEAMRVLRTD